MPYLDWLLSFVTKPSKTLKITRKIPTSKVRKRCCERKVMSLESQMKAVIQNRKNNFYSMFDDYMVDDEYYFTEPDDPSFDFEPGSDEEKIYNARIARFKTTSIVIDSNSQIYYTEDESSEFFGYTYDEIIGMANNGVTIPDEILDWAYAMADANAVEITTDTEGSSAHDLYTSLKNNPFLNIKTITKIFVNKCDEKTQELEAYLDELTPIEKEMDSARVEAETEKENSLNELKSLIKEWKDLQAKMQSGQELSQEEQDRFTELQGLFAEEDEKYQDNIDDTTRNFTKINEKLSVISGKANVAFDFGAETVFVAKELAEFEKKSKNRSILGGLIGAGIVGVLGAIGLAGNKKFSETAYTVGINTQYFAEDINTTIKEVQLLMQDTADTAGFDGEDPSRTVDPLSGNERVAEPTAKGKTNPAQPAPSSDGTEIPPAEAPIPPEDDVPPTDDGTEPAPENAPTDSPAPNPEEEPTDEEIVDEGENALVDVDAKKLSLPKLKRLIEDEGKDSEKKGKEALKLVEQLKAQSAVVDKKEEDVEESSNEVNETSEEEPTEGTDGNDALEDAQTTAEEDQAGLDAATKEEALTVEGLRETFKASTSANKKYTKDVDYANKEMKDSIKTGAFTITGGGYMTGVGIYNVVQGSAFLSAGWWNPVLIALGTYMINQGTTQIILGGLMIAGGTALTVLADDGLKINEDTAEKIGVSEEEITTATTSLDEIEREQKGQVEGGEGADTPEEDENTEEPKEDEALNKDKSLLGMMKQGNETLPPLRSLSLSEGKQSSVLGKENVQKLTALERQIPSLIESTITFEQEKMAQTAESADPEADKNSTSVQDPAEIYAEYRNDYQADLATNNAFKKDIKEADTAATTNLNYAAIGTAAGTARTTLGVSEIALGTILAAQWLNPVAMMIGLALIKKGTENVALGSEMLAVGLALTVNSTTTLAADAIASKQVSESDEKTNKALNRVNAIEAEINAAVKEQLAANGEQDLSGMSVIELLTLIIMNGIKSSALGVENTEILEMLKAELPKLVENAGSETQQPSEEEVSEDPEEATEPENNEGEDGEGEEETYFTQYKNDFKTDLATNLKYGAEISQAKNMAPVLKGSFFLGAPIEKATSKIQVSNEQTITALEETEKMEEELKKAEEEKRKAQEEAEKAQGGPAVAGKNNTQGSNGEEEEEVTPEDAAGSASDSEDAADDSEKQVKDDAKTIKKQGKQEKKQAKTVKKDSKKAKQIDKEAKKADKEGQDNEKLGLEQQKQGEETAANSNQDEVQAQADQTANELGEAEAITGEVEGIVAEVEGTIAETQSEAAAANAENQGIVAEMNLINMELQQDQTKMQGLNNELKNENKGGSSEPSKPEPQPQEEPQPQPAAQPKKAPKKAPKKDNKVEKDKPEQTPPQEEPKPQAQAPAQPEAPEGSDKIDFASNRNKQPDFIGFVAQSDSLASGSVLASSKAKTAPTNNQGNKQGQSLLALKNKQKKKQQKEKTEAVKDETQQGQQAQPQVKAAKRTTQKPFDISSMQGGANGGGKGQQIRTSMEAIRTAAFTKQARLNAMYIRANNNAMANIQKEALAQAEAAKKERLALEKQERIAKIKEYAGYVQMAGGLTTTAGMIVTKVGTVQQTAGTAQVTAGTTQLTAGTSQVAVGSAMVATGTAQLGTGGLQIGTGTAMTATGATFLTSGTVVTTTGTTMTTTGNVMIATGTAMLSNPFTAAAGAALVVSGTSLTVSGASMIASGATLTVSGGTQTGAGTAQIGTGTALMGTGATTISSGMAQISAGTAQIVAGTGQIVAGTAQIASGVALAATGATIQTIGTIVTAAGAATSAGADIANGNILGGIASIVGAAASVVGVAAPVSQLGNAAIQLGSQGINLAGQLTTMNAGQENNNGNQDQKKKKKFKQNARTQGIIDKTANHKQKIGNRFNK